jgi:hypothetical protein
MVLTDPTGQMNCEEHLGGGVLTSTIVVQSPAVGCAPPPGPIIDLGDIGRIDLGKGGGCLWAPPEIFSRPLDSFPELGGQTIIDPIYDGSGGVFTSASGLGDLSWDEVQQIQRVVDQAGRPLVVVRSAAKGERRGVGTDLPIGKGTGTKSDIDYLVPPGSLPYYDGLEGQFPSIDPKHGIIPGVHNPFIGPAIRFEPETVPYPIPETAA